MTSINVFQRSGVLLLIIVLKNLHKFVLELNKFQAFVSVCIDGRVDSLPYLKLGPLCPIRTCSHLVSDSHHPVKPKPHRIRAAIRRRTPAGIPPLSGACPPPRNSE